MNALDRVNPVTRLICAFVLTAPVLITLDWVSSAALLVLELAIFTACGAGLFRMLRGLIPVAVIAAIASVSMALYGRPGGTVFLDWWWVVISERSLLMALAVFLRILALALAATVLLARVDPTLMADGLAQRLHLSPRFVLGTLAGVRLLGLFATDWRMLGLARRARGLGDTGAVRRQATMAFALLVTAIRRASTLATAMEVRDFTSHNAKNRTWARPSPLGAPDAIGLIVTLALIAASLAAAVWAGTFWFIWGGQPV
jgi:energy-coupling factor transport system permease protein